MNFGFVPPHAYLHFAGVSSAERIFIYDKELVEMTVEERIEFSHILHVLTNTPGISVMYEPKFTRYVVYYPIPCITTMDTNRLEYENEA